MKKYFLGLLILFLTLQLRAQGGLFSVLEKEHIMSRVKQIDQFFARFNGQEDGQGRAVSSYSPLERQMGVLSLFDRELIVKNKDNEAFRNKIERFVKLVSDEKTPILLKFEPADWELCGRFKVRHRGRAMELGMSFRLQRYANGGMAWVISGVDSSFVQAYASKRDLGHFIPPNTHETDFIELQRTFQDTVFTQSYFAQNFEPDAVTLFYAALRRKEIKVENALSLVYHFRQIPQYLLKVKYFNREGGNSGWLISEIEEKAVIKKR